VTSLDQATTDEAVAAVLEHVTRERLAELVCGVVDIASPTGYEAPLAEWISHRLNAHGVRSEVQYLDAAQANAVGVVPGGDGPSILLYAPLDTFTTGDPALDLPAAGPVMRPDMLATATVTGDIVEGLGAGNPKGHAAVILAVVEAMAAAGIELPGDVVAGLGAGGMPSFAVDGVGTPGRSNTGHGVGAGYLLERGYTTDYAVIAKPGWAVFHEEVGLVWVDIHVPGIHTYVGSRHRLPYRNAVALAGEVAIRVERWLADYAERHEYQTMKPQGVISSIHGGFDRLAASTAADVRLRLDLRITTRQSPPSVVRELRAEVCRIGAELGADLRVEQVAAIPATYTSPDSPVVRAAVGAFETVSGRPHQVVMENSGATDANILRMRGVETARVGMPKVPHGPDGGPVDFTRGMNLVDLSAMRQLAEILVRTVLSLPSYDAGVTDSEGREVRAER
jgi:acetylornithine deacetylase/succinyl-diaminopimelate desuccinylase-like protein